MSRTETLISFFGDRRPGPHTQVPANAELSAEQSAVIAEACTRSSVVWLRPVDDNRRRLAWQTWHADAVHVVYGVGEQMLPMLTGHVEVTVPSKQTRAVVVTFLARARILAAGSPEWDAAAQALRTVRLNTPDPQGQAARWEDGCLISRLQPVHVLSLGSGSDDAPSQAAPPRPGQGTTVGWRPWHLGGRPGQRRRRRSAPGTAVDATTSRRRADEQ